MGWRYLTVVNSVKWNNVYIPLVPNGLVPLTRFLSALTFSFKVLCLFILSSLNTFFFYLFSFLYCHSFLYLCLVYLKFVFDVFILVCLFPCSTFSSILFFIEWWIAYKQTKTELFETINSQEETRRY